MSKRIKDLIKSSLERLNIHVFNDEILPEDDDVIEDEMELSEVFEDIMRNHFVTVETTSSSRRKRRGRNYINRRKY